MKKILTLCIVHQGDPLSPEASARQGKVLLGMKKRGFGQGRWNGFGGKVEAGETIEEAARREMQEEVIIQVNDLMPIGILDFSWQGKEDVLQVNIFKVTDFSGDPTETEEMKPQWFNVSEIPFDQMWSDDKYWMSLFLENKKFTGKFLFDEKDQIVEYELHESQSN